MLKERREESGCSKSQRTPKMKGYSQLASVSSHDPEGRAAGLVKAVRKSVGDDGCGTEKSIEALENLGIFDMLGADADEVRRGLKEEMDCGE